MIREIKKSTLSILLALSMILSLFSNIAFADETFDIIIGGVGYNFTDNSAVKIVIQNSNSPLLKYQLSKNDILAGIKFGDVLPSSITNSSDSNSRPKNLYISPVTGGRIQIQNSSSISFSSITSIDVYDDNTKTISTATISIETEWDNQYAFFSPRDTEDALDNGTWNDDTSNSIFLYKEDGEVPSPIRTGYTFSGWQNGNSNGISWGNTSIHTPKWSANQITLDGKLFNGLLNSPIEEYLLSAENGTGSYSYSINEGDILPNGITFSDGKFSGTFLEAGTFNINVTAQDLISGSSASAKFTFDIVGDESLKVVFPNLDSLSFPYGTKLSDISFNEITLESQGQGNGTFQWKEPDTIPVVNNNGYTVVFVPTENPELYGDNFEFERNINVNITPANIVMEDTPRVPIVYVNNQLSRTIIGGGKFKGVFDEELKGKKEWKEPTLKYTSPGKNTATAIFTPENSNYNPLEFELLFNTMYYSSSSSNSNEYIITARSSDGGSINPRGNIYLTDYDSQTFTFEPDDGYEIDYVEIDGDEITLRRKSSYRFQSVYDDHDIYVRFKKIDSKTTRSTTKSRSSKYNDDDDDEDIDKDEKVVINDKKDNDKVDFKVQNNNVPDVSSIFNTVSHTAYLRGYTDGTFKPKNSLTRAEACVILSSILKQGMENTTYSSSFSDVNPNDWYYNYVGFLSNKGILKGYPDGTFRPNNSITRAELAHIISEALELEKSASNDSYSKIYNDIDDNWAVSSISLISYYGWLKGYEDGSFKPNANITRAETASFINSVLGRKNIDETSFNGMNIEIFPDVLKTDWYYNDVIEACNTHNYEYMNFTEKWKN